MENIPVAAEWIPEWKDPAKEHPPRGTSLHLMTEGGVVVRGQWSDDGRFIAWYPFLKKPDWLKRKLMEAYSARLSGRES
jgi:hypothetical protein